MNTKKKGFTDKVIFILGLTLGSVFAFVLVVGVIVAIFKFYLDSKKQPAQIHAIPLVDEPEVELFGEITKRNTPLTEGEQPST
ncbi:hypothetical protein [Paenibacillus planticolens]|uniref:Uncharacterized protein n=1 Tax=Paenibacillus planticolens TaxID=2654976 RepID=A0ABX1ZL41_9BACL|nr:hypothetical protein [Paenibacillus planticolens]NOU99734.1 hypothetical protein [Paenibacillus planticolens]